MASKEKLMEDNGLTEQQKMAAAVKEYQSYAAQRAAKQAVQNAAVSGIAAGVITPAATSAATTPASTNPNNPNGINPKGIVKKSSGSGTAATSTAASATATQTPVATAAQPTQGTVAARPAQDPYQESAEVQAAREAYQASLQGRPEYQVSQAVLDAQAALQGIENSKPKGYESKYGAALDSLLQQIQNPGGFKYEFNGDNLFKQYSDLYTQQGKQASMDAMGQAATLTGGYGNSYAQLAGQQANQQYLTQLYDRGMDLYDRAYQRWRDEQAGLYDQYNLLANADQSDYGRYRDTVGDWENERSFLTNRYDTERGLDYSQYRDTVGDWTNARDFAANQYNAERSLDYGRYQDARDFGEQQYQYDTEINEKVREFDESLNWDKMSAEQKYAAEYAMQILAKGQMPSDALLKSAGLSAADAKKLKASKKSGGGTGSGKPTTYYTNANGKLYKIVNGKMVEADASKVTDKDVIDHSIENIQNNAANMTAFTQRSVAEQILEELNKNKK